MNKAVDIMCTSSGWRYCPFTGETWACNNGYAIIEDMASKLDKLFLMHKQVYITASLGRRPIFDFNHMQSASEKYGFRIVSWHKIPELKNTEKYPFEKICQFFKTTYFASSHCYMIAYALYKGYEKIRLYGMDFVPEVSKFTDDLWERCGTEYWIGRAQGMGVKVEIHEPSSLLTTRTKQPYAING